MTVLNGKKEIGFHIRLFSTYIVRFIVTYIVLRLYVSPSIQEEGDGDKATIGCSQMEGGQSILPQDTHRQANNYRLDRSI